jgi:hypothetical protein
MSIETKTRRLIFAFLTSVATMLAVGSMAVSHSDAEEADSGAALKKKFELLSQSGNVECSTRFEASIATMARDATLHGSCCAPMDDRYRQQIDGLKKFRHRRRTARSLRHLGAPSIQAHGLLRPRPQQGGAGCLRLRDGALGYAGPMLLQVLAVEGVWRLGQVPS